MSSDKPSNKMISKQSWMVAPETVKIMAVLNNDKGQARFAGGCVRDALANEKVVDIDIATTHLPQEVIKLLEAHKIKYAKTGFKHGTITAIINKTPFEITTLRADVRPFGRHSEVDFIEDWKKDASRRDFTINAMYTDMDGHVYDTYGGIRDLRAGRIIFVGDAEKRIKEDVLRILRFFRFHARFGKGDPDPVALAACAKQARLLPRLSAERIRHEILKLLETEHPADTWRLMIEHGIVTHFLPEASNVHTLAFLVNLERKFDSKTFSLRRLAALLDITAEGVEQIKTALKLSNTQTRQLKTMTLIPEDISTTMDHADVRRLVYRLGNDMMRSLLLLAAAKEEAENDLKNLYHWATTFKPPAFPLRGQDVMAQGISGEDIGVTLTTIENWWINEDFAPGRTACLEKLKSLTL